MKKFTITWVLTVLAMLGVRAQNTMRDKILKNRKEFSDRTLFQQFEQQIIPTAQERKEKSDDNKAKRELLLAIIDTTQIKLELKEKLQHDVVHNPFSRRLKKFMERHNLKEKVQSTD